MVGEGEETSGASDVDEMYEGSLGGSEAVTDTSPPN